MMPPPAVFAAPANRRARVRYRCDHAVAGQVQLIDGYATQAADVVDLSVDGIGLHLPERLDVGELVLVEVEGSGGAVAELLAEVAHTTVADDGSWRHGCRLVWGLSQAELQALLR
jgi:hypothetical protein